ncbi:hypothetical protein [Streptomyces anulatus]|uniref:Uncharacterized protein n=1 Tax=Streptomyces anulatus TaxID=1892 RepID=A0A7K3RBU4_STRAQ|nr:hypothetical protein [Streptomyces anulatus]NEB99471.1 hypothetical protein [Streptomyces anulatus]NED26771.1 hypothetical protein [Streptomyces anulatus]
MARRAQAARPAREPGWIWRGWLDLAGLELLLRCFADLFGGAALLVAGCRSPAFDRVPRQASPARG